MAERLKDKVVLITGTGGQGIGRAAALLFAQEGAKVVGCARKEEGGQETVHLVREAGGEMLSVDSVDLTDPTQAQKVADVIERTYGRLDVLYNNAAHFRNVPMVDMSWEDWRYTIANELDLVFIMTKAVLPLLIRSGGGSIINTSSASAVKGVNSGFAAHAAAKAGVCGLTRQLAVELGSYHIRVNTIVPGGIANPKTLEAVPQFPPMMGPGGADLVKRFGQPIDFARVALFLASDDSRHMSGAELVVDGGGVLSRGGGPGGFPPGGFPPGGFPPGGFPPGGFPPGGFPSGGESPS